MKNKVKFSIIVPVYNTEQYLERCFNSILSQTYKNYEVIVVNDGSTDSSLKIINRYKEFICINQKNQGLSMARNNGIKKATGDYLIFLDSDDFLDKDLLLNLCQKIEDQEIIRYQLAVVENEEVIKFSEPSFNKLNGGQAFKNICQFHFVENAYLYTIKRKYWLDNNFEFKKNRYHEDFGIIPEVVFKANKVSCINYVGYYYYQRENSIMNNCIYEKEVKKAFDVLEQGLEVISNICAYFKYDKYKGTFYSYIVNSIFIKLKALKSKDKKAYIKIIKDNNLLNYLLNDTIKRKIKKFIYKIRYKL